MNVKSLVHNELIEDAHGVWVLKNQLQFDYSEGAAAEKYLEKVLRSATDLGSRSSELETHIKDWSSEYHLSGKRAQLLSGFKFDRSLRVLEVGCGCGAVTRHLGKSFDQVVSIEGSLARARLAKLRTRDLPSVSVICAPFQSIKFLQPFDIVFVIGVYEYSASFVEGNDPYDAVLDYFSEILSPDGTVVIAIENQFGLKYFNGFREDHIGSPFEGLEGYHRRKVAVRTFGKTELKNRLKRRFPEVHFFYPYPDYKLPDCVLTGEFLASERAGELVSRMVSRDCAGSEQPLWDEPMTALELAHNGMLEFFSNSFLILAGRTKPERALFDQLAILYSSKRKSMFATQTRIIGGSDSNWTVSKRSRQGSGVIDAGIIKMMDADTPWLDAQSLQTEVIRRSKSRKSRLDEIFSPCREWFDLLSGESSLREGVRYVSGAHIDSIWQNVYPDRSGLRIVDREWIWRHDIPVNTIVLRAIYSFLSTFGDAVNVSEALRVRSGRTLMTSIGTAIGVKLCRKDFDDFVELQSEFSWVVFGVKKWRQRLYLRWFLVDRPTLRLFLRCERRAAMMASRIQSRLSGPRLSGLLRK